jgi:hypothetical protein
MALSCPALSDFLPTPSSSFRGWFMSGEMTGLYRRDKKRSCKAWRKQWRRRIYGDVVIKHLHMSQLQKGMATKEGIDTQ